MSLVSRHQSMARVVTVKLILSLFLALQILISQDCQEMDFVVN
jgi:hypothetical protein